MLFSYAQEYSPLFFHKVPIMLENSPIMVTYNGELCLLQNAFVWLAYNLSGYLVSWFVYRESSLYQTYDAVPKFDELITDHDQFIQVGRKYVESYLLANVYYLLC